MKKLTPEEALEALKWVLDKIENHSNEKGQFILPQYISWNYIGICEYLAIYLDTHSWDIVRKMPVFESALPEIILINSGYRWTQTPEGKAARIKFLRKTIHLIETNYLKP